MSETTNNSVRPGQAVNDLVAAIERALVGSEAAKVEKGGRRRDRDTGRLREHDVIITWQQEHHTIITAIECRDRSRPVGVPDIEAFAHKCDRTGIDHKMIVSSTGFRNTARTKSAALGVTLMDLTEVTDFGWCQMQFWIEDRREFAGFTATVYFVNDRHPSGLFRLFDCTRTEVTPDHIQATCMNSTPFPADTDRPIDEFVPVELKLQTVDWVGRDAADEEYPVAFILATGGYTTKRNLRPVTLHTYAGPHASYDVASADAVVGDVPGKMLMVHDESGTRVIWAPAG